MKVLDVDPGIFLFGLRINRAQKWIGLFLGRWVLVLRGSGDGKVTRNTEEREVTIYYYARQRCIEELIALVRGEKIEHGIGLDIQRAYVMSNISAIWTGKNDTPLD